jgi:hypothetical protein
MSRSQGHSAGVKITVPDPSHRGVGFGRRPFCCKLYRGDTSAGGLMWIFITAVFLVTVWLFYRWPKPTLKAVAVLLGVISMALVWFFYDQTESSKRWRRSKLPRHRNSLRSTSLRNTISKTPASRIIRCRC